MALTIRVAALNRAAGFAKLGITEQPAYSNRGHYVDQWNTDAGVPLGSPYCCSFVHSCFKRGPGYELGGGGSVSQLLAWARPRGYLVKRPRRGDLACFDFHEGDKYGPYGDHVGFVERTLALRWKGDTFVGWIQTCEANTSRQGDFGGSQSNGGGVFRRRRWITGSVGAVFVRVPG